MPGELPEIHRLDWTQFQIILFALARNYYISLGDREDTGFCKEERIVTGAGNVTRLGN